MMKAMNCGYALGKIALFGLLGLVMGCQKMADHYIEDYLQRKDPSYLQHLNRGRPAVMDPQKQIADFADQLANPAVIPVEDSPLKGLATAPVTIVVFSDFECVACSRVMATLKILDQQYPQKIRIVFKNKPLPIHAFARLAARAGVAAAHQDKFWEFHDLMFQNQKLLDEESLGKIAAQAKLNSANFMRDWKSPGTDARVARDLELAATLGVETVPAIFINGARVLGSPPLLLWRGYIEKALGSK